MKRIKMLLPLLFGSMLTQQATAAPNTVNADHLTKAASLYFIENKGQIVDQHHNPRTDIDFKIPGGNGLNIFIGTGKLHYQWAKPIDNGQQTPDNEDSFLKPQPSSLSEASSLTPHSSPLMMYRMDVTLLNANPNAVVVIDEGQSYYEQYYTTHTGPDGATAHTYRKITYKEVYPNIDWVFRINDQGKLEHDFIVHRGGKVSDIRLQYNGADKIRHNSDGSITVTTAFGSVTEGAPYCFAEDGQAVAGKFALENNTLSFATASHQGTLIIDPVLEWATYFGSTGSDRICYVANDKSGNVYITGLTTSESDIATTGSFLDTINAINSAFVTKFDMTGKCIWSTYYSFNYETYSHSICCDEAGNIYLSGCTRGEVGSNSGIATPGAYQTTFSGGSFDGFLTKFDSSGRRIWGSYYGGDAEEYNANQIWGKVACDLWGNIYLSGNTTSSSGIATSGTYQVAKNGTGNDAFLVKFDTAGNRIWGTYYGGSGHDYGFSLGCDTFGHVFLIGRTNSTDMPGIDANAHQPAIGGKYDAFVAMFDSSGQHRWGTYYGGAGDEYAPVAGDCDPFGHVYLTGLTASRDNIASPGSYQPAFSAGSADAFLAKFDTAGKRIWSTYFGGERDEYGYGVSFTPTGDVYLAGHTNSTTGIATAGAIQTTNEGRNDTYLAKFDSSGQLNWATYYGGVEDENCMSLSNDGMGNVYLSGLTKSITDISTPGSHQALPGGGNDGLLLRINDCDLYAPDTITGPVFVCRGATVAYVAELMPGVQSYTWTLPPSWQGSSSSDSITVIVGGETDTIRVAAEFFCGTGPEQILVVAVSPEPGISMPAGTTLCAGDSIELHANVASGMSWQWMRDGIDIPGETDSTLLTTQSGSYRVVTTVAHCTDTSAPVVVHPLPQPVVTQDGNTLSTESHYASYQWYYGAQSITGANQPHYTYAAGGDYRVAVTDTNGCTGMSEPFTPVGVRELASDWPVRVYPNPAQSTIQVVAAVPVSVAISGMDGREVMRTEQTGGIDISSLAEGLYLLQVQDGVGNVVHVEKLVKLAR